MLKASGAKIKSVRSVAIGFIAIVFLALLIFLLVNRQEDRSYQIVLGGRAFQLEIADTEAERVQGLSQRKNLAENAGMLFIFPKADKQCMWMKDMNFSLDIVWLNGSKDVVKVAEGLSSSTYPEAFCADNTKYVLEFNQDVVQETGLKVGQNISF